MTMLAIIIKISDLKALNIISKLFFFNKKYEKVSI